VELLLAKGAEVNAKTKSGRTPLHEAVEYSSKEVVELLVSKGADVTAKNEKASLPSNAPKTRAYGYCCAAATIPQVTRTGICVITTLLVLMAPLRQESMRD